LTPEAARFLDKARSCLADAIRIQQLVPRLVGREAYLAAYHAAEALLYERTGKIAKTHRGLRAQFANIARSEPRIDRPMLEFLAQAYELKSLADCRTGADANFSEEIAAAAVERATRFVDVVGSLLVPISER
jgi:uncharacterized protein (UPF0332 family)